MYNEQAMNRRNILFQALLVLLAVLGSATVLRAEPISHLHPRGYVSDFASVLDKESSDSITRLCSQIENKTGAQIAVVTVRSLDGTTIEKYAASLFNQWGIGPKDQPRRANSSCHSRTSISHPGRLWPATYSDRRQGRRVWSAGGPISERAPLRISAGDHDAARGGNRGGQCRCAPGRWPSCSKSACTYARSSGIGR